MTSRHIPIREINASHGVRRAGTPTVASRIANGIGLTQSGIVRRLVLAVVPTPNKLGRSAGAVVSAGHRCCIGSTKLRAGQERLLVAGMSPCMTWIGWCVVTKAGVPIARRRPPRSIMSFRCVAAEGTPSGICFLHVSPATSLRDRSYWRTGCDGGDTREWRSSAED